MELLQLCSSLITFLVLPSISLSRANAVKPFIFPASKTNLCKCGSPGLVVIGGDSCTECSEFECQHRTVDELLFTYVVYLHVCQTNCPSWTVPTVLASHKRNSLPHWHDTILHFLLLMNSVDFHFSYFLVKISSKSCFWFWEILLLKPKPESFIVIKVIFVSHSKSTCD